MHSNSAQFSHIRSLTQQYQEDSPSSFGDSIVNTLYTYSQSIAQEAVKKTGQHFDWDTSLDDILTSPITGIPIMLLLLGGVFWITIVGANYPSQILSNILFSIEARLSALFVVLGAPEWLHGILVLGMYRTFAWVVAVMLPPMAIFFPLFTFLEDLGYLPRAAFNLDRIFKAAGTHGKQALTISMGFGCNAAGVIACRIIDSPRERLIAIITNNFVPCNGRFPTLIVLATIFLGTNSPGRAAATAAVVGLVLVGIFITLIVSYVLSKTALKGVPSSCTLELPPYRKPQIGKILIRSFLDRTLFVLRRAVIVALPAGAVVWLLANTYFEGQNLITILAGWLDPAAGLLGMDGIILMAFLLGLPANEIVIPIIIMSYLSSGAMLELATTGSFAQLLLDNGWTWATALSVMLFSLLHFPCATTLWTIKAETRSWKWTAFTLGLTTGIACFVCFIVYQTISLLFL